MDDSSSNAEDDRKAKRVITRCGTTFCAGESLLVGLSYFFGIILAGHFSLSHQTLGMTATGIIFLSLGASFSYAFVHVFRKEYQSNFWDKSRFQISSPIWNITFAYIIHLAILFLVNDQDFSLTRASIGIGYLTGSLAILGFRFLVRSLGPNPAHEGKKRIIIKGLKTPVPANQAEIGINRVRRHSFMIAVYDKFDEAKSERAKDPR